MKMKEEIKADYEISNRCKAITHKEFGRGCERSFLRGSWDLLYMSASQQWDPRVWRLAEETTFVRQCGAVECCVWSCNACLITFSSFFYSEEVCKRGFTVIVDMRGSKWDSIKPLLKILQESFPCCIHVALIIKPDNFWQKQRTNFGSSKFEFEVISLTIYKYSFISWC